MQTYTCIYMNISYLELQFHARKIYLLFMSYGFHFTSLHITSSYHIIKYIILYMCETFVWKNNMLTLHLYLLLIESAFVALWFRPFEILFLHHLALFRFLFLQKPIKSVSNYLYHIYKWTATILSKQLCYTRVSSWPDAKISRQVSIPCV